MNFLKMKKQVASVVAAAMITTTLVPMGAIAMAENQTEKKAVKIVHDKLSLRDRSIVTVCSLIGSGVIDSSLKYHLATAKKNGVTKEEMAEIITQLGFYVGWPKAWAAFNMAKEVYAE